MTDASKISAPDLTQRPPRSPRCRLGGYVILPRMLDKGRATIISKNGDFKYDAPLISTSSTSLASIPQPCSNNSPPGEATGLCWTRNHFLLRQSIGSSKEQVMPEKGFFHAILFAVYGLQKGNALMFIQLKFTRNLADDFLSSTKLFDDSAVFE